MEKLRKESTCIKTNQEAVFDVAFSSAPMINARIKKLDTGVRIFLSDYLTEDSTLSVVGASADFADVLKTAVTNISTTATATPVKPNPLEERFIGRLLLFKPTKRHAFCWYNPNSTPVT